MLDNEFHISSKAKATLISIVCPDFPDHDTEENSKRSLVELHELLRTLGISACLEFIQTRKNIDPATVFGSGKLQEIAQEAKNNDSHLIVCDFELTASQVRNIKKITGMDVVDRVHVILEIFSRHARTKDAHIQIEIARLQYVLPRLSGFWTHLNRQRGGVGVMSGEGEKQIELDRRIIKDRIQFYKKQLEEIQRSRLEQRKRRQNQTVTAALVGYTNAGKSSIMNRLCRVNVLEEDKLFATLDSTFRTLNPDTKPPMILIDTVGFISNLPNTLIEGFKTTLDSALEADLLIIVCDISDPNYKKQLDVTHEVLAELGLKDKDKIIVFNKKDKMKDMLGQKIILRSYPGSFLVSSLDAEDMKNLRKYIIDFFLSKQDHHDLFVPYHDGNAHSLLMSKTNILNTTNLEKGIFYRIRTPKFIFDTLNVQHYILSEDNPLYQEIMGTMKG